MSIEGAGLIAQIIPVLLLILAIERRALGPLRLPARGKPHRKRRLALLAAGGISVACAFTTEFGCVTSVAQQQRLPGWQGVLVGAYMLLLGIVVTVTLLELYLASVFGLEIFRQTLDQAEKSDLIKYRAKRVHKLSTAKPKTRN